MTTVLDGIICFSVQFCKKSLLVLKIHFLTRVFHWQEDINVIVISAFSSIKPYLNFLKFFSQDIWGNAHYVPEIKLISKSLLSPKQNKIKEIFYFKTRFCRQMTAEDNNSKRKVSPNIPCTFLLFKTSVFLFFFQ